MKTIISDLDDEEETRSEILDTALNPSSSSGSREAVTGASCASSTIDTFTQHGDASKRGIPSDQGSGGESKRQKKHKKAKKSAKHKNKQNYSDNDQD